MHILGKIFTWMLVLAAGTATTLMARQLQIRNSYTKRLADLEKENKERAARIAKKERELASLEAELDSVMTGWETYWDQRTGGQYKNPQKPNLAAEPSFFVGVGTRENVGTTVQNPAIKVDTADANKAFQTQLGTVMHVFRQADPNTSIYVGPFELPADSTQQDNSPNGVRMLPQWALRPGEYDSWDHLGNVWRYRTAVPVAYPEQLIRYYLRSSEVDGEIASARKNLQKRQAELETAKKEITRYREIIAGPDGLSGILADLDREDEKRNAIQAEVDALRREVKRNLDLRSNLVNAIKKMAQTLPQPQADAKTSASQ
ncbi:MAG: hypothetical protein Tsb009_37520 [Planctomycetaceae bacterium]